MKRLLLFLLLIASIGCKKELAPQGEQKFKLSDFIFSGCGCGEASERMRLDTTQIIIGWIIGDTVYYNSPNLIGLDIKGSLILGLGDTSRDEAMQNLNGCETQVLMRHGDGKYSDNVLTFTKKRVGSYLIRDGDIIESMDYNTLRTLPAIQVGTTATDKYYDLEYNPTNNVSSKDGNRYYDRIKFANWPPKNYKYFRQ